MKTDIIFLWHFTRCYPVCYCKIGSKTYDLIIHVLCCDIISYEMQKITIFKNVGKHRAFLI